MEDYLRSLDKVNKARFQHFFKQHHDGHRVKNPQHLRLIGPGDPKVYELKANIARLYLVAVGRIWWATHGGPKPAGNRQVNDQVDRSRKIFWEGGHRE